MLGYFEEKGERRKEGGVSVASGPESSGWQEGRSHLLVDRGSIRRPIYARTLAHLLPFLTSASLRKVVTSLREESFFVVDLIIEQR